MHGCCTLQTYSTIVNYNDNETTLLLLTYKYKWNFVCNLHFKSIPFYIDQLQLSKRFHTKLENSIFMSLLNKSYILSNLKE